MKNKKSVLKKYFGYNNFRGNQESIISEIINGNSTMVIMPTGGGKSLCYQIPAILLDGLTIVVSPLIALMQDQVSSLQSKGISAFFINSTISYNEQRSIIKKIEDNQVDILYVAPERLLEPSFYSWLKTIHISLFAIDEAHCVSQWGHDFRPVYVELQKIVTDFSNVPRIALTATANETTRNEIISRLGFQNSKHFISGFDRPNIHYTIQEKSDEKKQLLKYIKKNHIGECGIVYCLSRKKTEEISEFLSNNGFKSLPYHAKLSNTEKEYHLSQFLESDDIIIVATIAFGMGIDKPNVRFVCHVDLPSSIEAYYQETGRAGRDGLPSYAWMLYGLKDVALRRNMLENSNAEEIFKRIDENNLNSIFSLCEVVQCRRKTLVEYFGDHLEKPCNNCDNCNNPPLKIDATIFSQKLFSTIYRTGQKFGANYIIDVLTGKSTPRILSNKHNELSVFGIGKDIDENNWKSIIRQLIVLNYIKIDPQYGSMFITEKCRSVLKSQSSIELKKFNKKISKFKQATHEDDLSIDDQIVFIKLKEIRLKLSKEYKVPPYIILNNKSLLSMIHIKPKNIKDLLLIDGIGDKKANDIGKYFIDFFIQKNNS